MSSARRAVGRGGCLGNGEPLYSADRTKATGIGDKMNLPSASYIARCVKPSHSRESSSDLVPDFHVTRNGGYYQSNSNRSPEIMSEHIASEYSDAGDTFACRPSHAGDEDHHDARSSGPHGNTQCGHKDVASRDFILKRFLPAAQAMTAADGSSSAPASSLPSEHRPASLPNGASSIRTSSRPGSFESGSSRSKSRYFHEVKQDVCGVSEDGDEERLGACGFPLHLGRLTLLQFRYSFWTSRSSSRTKLAPQTAKQVSKKVIQDEASDNSDDLFWSDEEGFEDAMSQSNASVGSMNGRESMTSNPQMRKGLAAEMLAPPARSIHSMETVHTPDHRGFLGVPKTSNLSSGEMERARQVDRLGARLTRMLSKANYVESRDGRVHDQNEFEAGDSRQGPSATTASTSAEAQKTKWVDARASLRPPPSPKMPSESWLSNTLPPERLLLVKKLSRKPLGSFIPINPPLKPTSEQPNCEEEITRPNNLRQSSSLKEHLHGRQTRSPTMQEI